MELIINRKRWGRGKDGGLLLDSSTDKMCCLGFAGRACGIAKDYLYNQQMPGNVENEYVKRNKDFWSKLSDGVVDTKLAVSLARINDDEGITDVGREKAIIAGFKKIGVTVTFKN